MHLIFTYPSIYPDVLPDMFFEPIDEDSGELSEPESEEVLTQLRIIVSLAFWSGLMTGGRESRDGNDVHDRCCCSRSAW